MYGTVLYGRIVRVQGRLVLNVMSTVVIGSLPVAYYLRSAANLNGGLESFSSLTASTPSSLYRYTSSVKAVF